MSNYFTEYHQVALLGTLLSRSFAGELFRLLLIYQDISSSEAASRLDLHIKTVQDFLEGLYALGMADRQEVVEGKRPYYRYRLLSDSVRFEFDLNRLRENGKWSSWKSARLKEKANNNAIFSTGARQEQINSITLFRGEGRNRSERKLSLTQAQGRFMFHIPFPNMPAMELQEIMKKADLDEKYEDEIIDLLNLLERFEVIEKK